jgi:hypothetical protein
MKVKLIVFEDSEVVGFTLGYRLTARLCVEVWRENVAKVYQFSAENRKAAVLKMLSFLPARIIDLEKGEMAVEVVCDSDILAYLEVLADSRTKMRANLVSEIMRAQNLEEVKYKIAEWGMLTGRL